MAERNRGERLRIMAQQTPLLDGLPEEVLGNGIEVPVVGGRRLPYAYLDNAASTPALRAAAEAVGQFLPWYSSVHRGAGYKSRLATAAYEQARERVRHFVNADDRQTVVFVKNTTEGLNRLARLSAARGTTIFSSIMEHHANMLPWWLRGRDVRFIQADARGVIDEDHLRRELRAAPAGPRLVAVAGAYNVTGYAPPIHRLARLAHEHGAEILVDGAQLVPHRQVDLQGTGPDERIDYLVFSSHKLYAPFGSGAMVAPRRALASGEPDLLGGGIVDLVTLDEVVWNGLPDREEAGSPNVVGAIALGAALARLEELGRERLEAQEAALTAHALARLATVPGLRVLGPPAGPDRVGVISFVLDGVRHGLVAAALAYEHAIGVRNGCFCAHPGILHLLALDSRAAEAARARLRRHDHADTPGAVRASFGLQNTRAEVDRLVVALRRIAACDLATTYRADAATGDYRPDGWQENVPDAVRALIGGQSTY
ncbi:MAG: aminotransferase class V-fold PLP-dependent enzyme [Chloroflexi bacterium]|nr:aminotransferase class V-fold PLP-dependent enzyme [Chloroflexota bacterium]